MKFQKVLAEFAGNIDDDDQSGAANHLLNYKTLKKLLKAAADEAATLRKSQTIAEQDAGSHKDALASSGRADKPQEYVQTTSEKEFVRILQEDVKRINTYFMEQEEAAVIRLQALRDRRAALPATLQPTDAEAKALHAAFVNLHGELILLFHYSMVNYAGVMKILKKHDKILGAKEDRRKDYLHTLLQQPFTSTESISRLVKEAEEEINSISPSVDELPHLDTTAAPSSMQEEGAAGQLMKRTRAALNMLEQLQQTAHTPSTLLPATTALRAPDAKRHKPTNE